MELRPGNSPPSQWPITRRPLSPLIRRIMRRCRVSERHARAFIEANGIGGQIPP
jgi:hypothetical protein